MNNPKKAERAPLIVTETEALKNKNERLEDQNKRLQEALRRLEENFVRLLHANARIKLALEPLLPKEGEAKPARKPSLMGILSNPALLSRINQIVPAIVKEVTEHVGPVAQVYLKIYPLPQDDE
jgi:predicted nuclease with TOPRIM domain